LPPELDGGRTVGGREGDGKEGEGRGNKHTLFKTCGAAHGSMSADIDGD